MAIWDSFLKKSERPSKTRKAILDSESFVNGRRASSELKDDAMSENVRTSYPS